MVSRDYTQELGLKPSAPVIPLPIAIAILALGGAALWYGVSKLNLAYPSQSASQEATAENTAKPAPPRAPAGR